MKDLNYLIKTLEKFSKNSAPLNANQNIQGLYGQSTEQAQLQNSIFGQNDQSQQKRVGTL